MKTLRRIGYLILICMLCLTYCFLKSAPIQSYRIITSNQTLSLNLEVADTVQKRTLGLMFRKSLAANDGMIFLFDTLRKGSMWMKNTYIPLDMLFFNEKFEIVHIHENAVPHDETIITTPMPVWGVIEVNAGYAKKNNIQPGDKIICPPKKDDR